MMIGQNNAMQLVRRTVSYLLQHKIVLLVVILGWIITLMPIVFDGHYGCLRGTCGFIIGTNYRDGIWYLAVADTAFRTFPFRMPNFAGAPLQGYHFLPNLLSYLLSLVGIPITFSFYQLFPFIYIFLLTICVIHLARRIKDDPRFIAVFLFFSYFAVPFTLFTSLYHYGTLRNSLIINTFQTSRLLESIHGAFAYVILITVLIILYRRKLEYKHKLVLGVLIFLLLGIKFYTAVLVLFMVGAYETLTLFRERRLDRYIGSVGIYTALAIAGILLFYNPFVTLGNGPIFTFSPFATVHHIIESLDYIYLPTLVNARYYLYTQGWGPRLIAIELFSTFLYVVFYLGTRVVGLFSIAYAIGRKKITLFELTLIVTILFGFAMSVLFVQRGDWFNPMQFAVYAALLMNYFAAKFIYELITSKRPLAWVFAAFVIILTLPNNLVNLGYLGNPARFVIPAPEMKAMDYLRTLPDGPVFLPIFEHDTVYTAAFTGKPTYLNYVILVDNAGIKADERKKLVANLDFDVNKLNVRYVYIPKAYPYAKRLTRKFAEVLSYKLIYRNQLVTLFENTKYSPSR